MTVLLLPLTLAFFSGRLVSYSLYVAGASAAKDSLGVILEDSLTSPLGLVLQVAMLALIALVRVDWTRFLHHPQRGGDVHPPQSPHGE